MEAVRTDRSLLEDGTAAELAFVCGFLLRPGVLTSSMIGLLCNEWGGATDRETRLTVVAWLARGSCRGNRREN